MASLRTFDLGPAVISYGGTDLQTHGPVRLAIKASVGLLHNAENGTTPIGGKYLGYEVTVRVPVTRETWENLAEVSPGTTLTAGERLIAAPNIGTDVSDYAQWLIIKPVGAMVISGVEVDHDPWKEVFLYAYPVPMADLTYGEEQAVYEVEFRALDASLSAEVSSSWFVRFGPENTVATNAGFEEGDLTDWVKAGDFGEFDTGEVTDSDAYTGTYSYYHDADGSNDRIERNLGSSEFADNTYVLACRANIVATDIADGADRLRIQVFYQETGEAAVYQKLYPTATSGAWELFTKVITIPDVTLDWVYVAIGGIGEAYFDDIQLVKVS